MIRRRWKLLGRRFAEMRLEVEKAQGEVETGAFYIQFRWVFVFGVYSSSVNLFF